MQGKLGKGRLGKGTHYKHLEHGRKMDGSYRQGRTKETNSWPLRCAHGRIAIAMVTPRQFRGGGPFHDVMAKLKERG